MKTKYFFLTSVLFLAGCGKTGEIAVSNDVQNTIATNGIAADHLAWESSPDHPEHLFARWTLDRTSPENVCRALSALSAENLALFENEIKKVEYAALTEPCRENLQQSLKSYWEQQEQTQQIALNFRFPGTVVTRDMDAGYYAVSAELKPKQILLTFDDGPHADHTDSILSTLADTNAKSMFFHMGRQVRQFPSIVKRVAAGGHVVGSHSMTHACLAYNSRCDTNNRHTTYKGKLSFAQATTEIMRAHQAIYDVLGWVDPVFRFPYGESSAELKKWLARKATGEFFWAVDSDDWRKQTSANLHTVVMNRIRATKRGVVLFHDIQARTALALPGILKDLYFEGYDVVLLKPDNPKARYNSQLVTPKSKLP